MDLTEVFFNWQTALLCCAVYVATLMVKKIIENTKPMFTTGHWWKEVLLPALPVVVGVLVVVASVGFPWPAPLKGWAARVMYGIACGFFSERVYTFVSKTMDGLKAPPPAG